HERRRQLQHAHAEPLHGEGCNRIAHACANHLALDRQNRLHLQNLRAMSQAENQVRPRRSCLYMPGANAKALEKAKTLAADTLIFDLEDSVAPEAKAEARGRIGEALAAGGYGKREIIVRVNALATPWGGDDIRAAGASRPAGVLVPKVESAA